jgi:TonB family protein
MSAAAVFGQIAAKEEAVRLLNAGNNAQAAEVLKKIAKASPQDAEAYFLLGRAQLHAGREKDSIKSFERAAKLGPNEVRFLSALSYAYLSTWNPKAKAAAERALAIDAENAEANLVLAVVAIRDHSYDESVERAGIALKRAPNLAPLLHLRSKALIGSFASEPYPAVRAPEARIALLDQAKSDLEKYVQAEKNPEFLKDSADYIESVRYFAEYYRQPGRMEGIGKTRSDADPAVTPLRITRKDPPEYTSSARAAGVKGTSILIVQFGADGKIGHILVAKPLEDSLDRQAIRAARAIRFEPQSRNGVEESAVKRVEYSFDIR